MAQGQKQEKASIVAKAMATTTTTTKASHMASRMGSFHIMEIQQSLIELLLYLFLTGPMIHGILPHGIKTTSMDRIGLNHGVKVVSGHGRSSHLR